LAASDGDDHQQQKSQSFRLIIPAIRESWISSAQSLDQVRTRFAAPVLRSGQPLQLAVRNR
jgi:hypothetical protein